MSGDREIAYSSWFRGRVDVGDLVSVYGNPRMLVKRVAALEGTQVTWKTKDGKKRRTTIV